LQAIERGIELKFPAFEVPCLVNADPIRLKQVLINLLSNAIKYNRRGGTVCIMIEDSASRNGNLRISVRDTGVGLSPGQLAQLFQPFNRLGRESGMEEGTGIGLVVTKQLVELMGGKIGVDSTVNVGSTFWIELGLTIESHVMSRVATPVVSTQLKTPSQQALRSVLYVEDNPANLALVEQLIANRSDLHLLSATDGDRGIELARIYRPQVILMDINLPGISGLAVMNTLRADPLTAAIPIIAVSANAMPQDIAKAIDAGFFDYLTKPIRVNLFFETLDRAMDCAAVSAPVSPVSLTG